MGYDEVDAELGQIVMSISVSLKDGDVNPFRGGGSDIRAEEQAKMAEGRRKEVPLL